MTDDEFKELTMKFYADGFYKQWGLDALEIESIIKYAKRSREAEKHWKTICKAAEKYAEQKVSEYNGLYNKLDKSHELNEIKQQTDELLRQNSRLKNKIKKQKEYAEINAVGSGELEKENKDLQKALDMFKTARDSNNK